MNSKSSENFVIFEQDNDLLVESTTILQDLRKREIFCDVVVKAGDQEFSAHRVMLAAKIPYFHTMFTSNYKESKQREVIVNGVDPLALGALIDFCYSGKIRIDLENVQELMKAADFVQLIKVKTACANFLKTKIQADNVFGIQYFANSMNCQELLLAAEQFIKENFSEISESKEFLQLKFEELMKLVQHKDKNCSEENVFEAVMRWVKHEEAERACLLPEILLKVELTKVPYECLVKFVNKEKLLQTSLECLRIFDKAKDFHLPQGRNKLTQRNQDSKKFNHTVQIISSNHQIFLKYDIIRNEWHWKVTEDNLGNLKLFGSFRNNTFMITTVNLEGKLSILDPVTSKWSDVNGKLNGISEYEGVIILNDCLYICGGMLDIESSSSVECYSAKENSWKYVTPMLTKRSEVGVTSLNESIYAIGGYNNMQGILDSCEKYDPTSNTWTYIKPMLEKRIGPIVATLNNKIYACGGWNFNNDNIYVTTCEVYNPATDSWSFVAPMSQFGYNIHLRVFDGKLYAFKSHDDEIKVEVYDPESNSWTQLKNFFLKKNESRLRDQFLTFIEEP